MAVEWRFVSGAPETRSARHQLTYSNESSIVTSVATADALQAVALHGTAMRAAAEGRPVAETIEELRRLAAGRNDLLAQEAGLTAGAWLAAPAMHVGHELLAAGLLILAGDGLDYIELERWVRLGLERGEAARRPVYGSL